MSPIGERVNKNIPYRCKIISLHQLTTSVLSSSLILGTGIPSGDDGIVLFTSFFVP